MKFFRWNKQYIGWGLTALAVIIASSIVLLVFVNQKEILTNIGNFFTAISPIFYGFIIAYLLAPIVKFFETRCFKNFFKKAQLKAEAEAEKRNANTKYTELKIYVKNKPRRILSITVTFVIMITILAGILIAVIPQLASTISFIVDNIPNYVKEITKWVQGAFASFPDISEEITSIINEAGSMLKNFLMTAILPQMGDYLGFLTNGIMSFIGIVLNVIFGIVVGIYCLYSKELFSAQAKKLIYCIMRVKYANRFIKSVRKIHKSFGSFITGTLIDSFIVGCITFIITTIFGVPFALLVSVIMGLTNIIPYFGPFIGIVPSLILIFMEDPFMCIVFTVIVLVIQNLNGNILSPRILGESTGLSSFWVIFAILAGQGLFGFWGLIIGIPVFAVIFAAVKEFVSSHLGKKGLPKDSDHYTDVEYFETENLTPVSLSETAQRELEKNIAEENAKKEQRKNDFAKKKQKLIEKINCIINKK